MRSPLEVGGASERPRRGTALPPCPQTPSSVARNSAIPSHSREFRHSQQERGQESLVKPCSKKQTKHPAMERTVSDQFLYLSFNQILKLLTGNNVAMGLLGLPSGTMSYWGY